MGTKIKLEGRLVDVWADELEKVFLAKVIDPQNSTIELDGLTSVDRRGEAVLAMLRGMGAELKSSTPLGRNFVEMLTVPKRAGGRSK